MANCWARPETGSSSPARSIHGCCGVRRSDALSLSVVTFTARRKPMYAVPDVAGVVAVAKELGIHLSPGEAGLYRKYLLEQLSQFDAFVQARLEEPRPPMVSAARKPGYRPTPEEDPLIAWTWKSRIEGTTEVVLAGKTVCYKDHITASGRP